MEELTRTGVNLDVRRFFSAAEVDALEALPPAEQMSRFFDYRTLKEAYIKARGMDLSLPLDGFSMQIRRGRPPAVTFGPAIDDDPSMWQFKQFDPSPHHRMAIAVRRRGGNLTVRIEQEGHAPRMNAPGSKRSEETANPALTAGSNAVP